MNGIPHGPSKAGRWLAAVPYFRGLPFIRLSRQLYLDRCTVSDPALPPAFSGFTIAYASDIHYGAFLDHSRVVDLAEKLNALDADLIILGGDYGDSAETCMEFWRILPPLRAHLGTYAVMGNHDRYHLSVRTLSMAMLRSGVTPLVNGCAKLTRSGQVLCICATDDCNHGQPDYQRTAADTRGADYVIYAPHSPDALAHARKIGHQPFFQLALCGHTHGGQIAPLGIALHPSTRLGWIYGQRYRTGLIRDRGFRAVISNGTGTTWIPLRLGAKPQYHLIRLIKGDIQDEQ